MKPVNQPQGDTVYKFYARNEGRFFAVLYLIPLLGLFYLLWRSTGDVGFKSYIPIALVAALFAFHCIPLFFMPYVTIAPDLIRIKVPPGLSKVPVLSENITRIEEGIVYLIIYYHPSGGGSDHDAAQDRLVIKIHSISPKEGQKMLQLLRAIVQRNQEK